LVLQSADVPRVLVGEAVLVVGEEEVLV